MAKKDLVLCSLMSFVTGVMPVEEKTYICLLSYLFLLSFVCLFFTFP